MEEVSPVPTRIRGWAGWYPVWMRWRKEK